MVEREAGDNGVERAVLFAEILEQQPAEALALRRRRIDAEHVVTRDSQGGRQRTPPAADLEHGHRRLRQLRGEELVERDQRQARKVRS